MKAIGIPITGHMAEILADKYGNHGDLFAAFLKHDDFRFERDFVVAGTCLVLPVGRIAG